MSQTLNEQELRAKSREILETTLKTARKSALAASLVPLALASASSAQAQASRVDATVKQEGSVYKYEFTVLNTSATESGKASPFQVVSWEIPLFNQTDVTNVTVPQGWAFEFVTPDASSNLYNNPKGAYGLIVWDYNPAVDPLLDASKGGNASLFGAAPDVFVKPPILLRFYTTADSAGNPSSGVKSFAPLKGFSFTSAYPGTSAPYRVSFSNQKSKTGDRPLRARILQIPNSPGYKEAVEKAPKKQ